MDESTPRAYVGPAAVAAFVAANVRSLSIF
jgi:hypothetical protein